MKKIHITTLGCFKNQVDSDVLAGQLTHRNFQITDQPDDADIILLNTCGFIEDAKKESIDAIFEAVDLKKKDKQKKVFVSGCLSQRYRNELVKEIPEIDEIFGTEDYNNILTTLGESTFSAEEQYKIRNISTPGHYAYIKISEGCNHKCSFCAIPAIRGKHKSRRIEEIIDEAKLLAEKGVKELILVSQDTSYYGKDIYDTQKIIELLEEIAKKEWYEWIRPLYWYPTNFPIRFIEMMSDFPSIIPYLDMPIQHFSSNVLRNMQRGETSNSIRSLYKKIKDICPDIALRTTLILGHPGETETDFSELIEFIKEIRFDRLGTFTYSDEDGTSAYNLKNKVEQNIAIERKNIIMELQQEISREKNEELIDTEQIVRIDKYDPANQCYIGRTYRDAPEIDNEVIIKSDLYQESKIGTLQKFIVTDAAEYELYGKFLSESMKNTRNKLCK